MEIESKENSKMFFDLCELLLSNKKVDEKSLKNIGIDSSLKSQKFGNILITNDFWSGLTVSVVNDQNDLNGNRICDNKRLIARIKNLYENGIKKIKITDLNELNIWKPAKEIVLGNLLLKNYSDILFSLDYYDISLIDEKKNIDGLWNDGAITTERILEVLHKFDIKLIELTQIKELELNKELELHLRNHFETVKKGGRSNQGDIDLILGKSHNYGIELKLARELSKASACQKAIGQIELYTRQFYGNFMLIVAGSPEEKNDKSVAEVVRKAKECKCIYYYLEAN
jgi:hypothetical protein